MKMSIFEDFGAVPSAPFDAAEPQDQVPEGDATPDAPPAGYDEGYSAGWEDATAQLEAEGLRVSEGLAAALSRAELARDDAMALTLASLGPALTDIFDRLLPQVAGRAFLPMLLQEVEAALDDAQGPVTLLVAPEEVGRVQSALARLTPDAPQVALRGEPALGLSQALIRWEGEARRIDLEAVLTALDGALDDLMASASPTPSGTGMDAGADTDHDITFKEAANG